MSTNASRYGMVAGIYDKLGQFWTRGSIGKSKHWQLQFVKPGDRVLFAGSGTSEEASHAFKLGAKIVIIDLSERMLSLARARFEWQGIDEVQFICADILEHTPKTKYDVIVANYFLDVFNYSDMKKVLRHLAGLLSVNGCLLIAGFTPPKGSLFSRLIAEIHHGIPLLFFYVFAGNALHRIYDYKAHLEELNFYIEERADFPIFRGLPFGVHAICAKFGRRFIT